MESWTMKGSLLGACNCAWGCPCNFDAPPTYGDCVGMYTWIVDQGAYGDVSLDGIAFGLGGHWPGPIHEGQGRTFVVIDQRATPEQQAAVEDIVRSGEAGMPFDAFASVSETWLDTIVTPIDVQLAGIETQVRMGDGGDLYELRLGPIPNPVTGEAEELYLDKPTGFTATRTELASAVLERFTGQELPWENRNTYGEYSEFSYQGP